MRLATASENSQRAQEIFQPYQDFLSTSPVRLRAAIFAVRYTTQSDAPSTAVEARGLSEIHLTLACLHDRVTKLQNHINWLINLISAASEQDLRDMEGLSAKVCVAEYEEQTGSIRGLMEELKGIISGSRVVEGNEVAGASSETQK